jgi:dihydrolipoamide dehydrogenase
VTGAEFVYAFNALGVRVTWLVDEYGVLPPFDRKPVAALVEVLKSRGVELLEGQATTKLEPDPDGSDDRGVIATLADGRTVRAEQAFVAIGRRPDVPILFFESLGLAPVATGPAQGGIAVDAYARTTVESVFAAGDVTGGPLVVNKAYAQAWTAARMAMGVATPPLAPAAWVQAVYAQPQVAQVGLTPDQARRRGVDVRVGTMPYRGALKSHLAPEMDVPGAFVDVVVGQSPDRVLGATAFGPNAAEVLAPVAMAIQLGATAAQLAASFPAHPTWSELGPAAAR